MPLAKVEKEVAIGRYPTSRFSLLELRPETGRKHQLRRHMSHIRHLLLGIQPMAIFDKIVGS